MYTIYDTKTGVEITEKSNSFCITKLDDDYFFDNDGLVYEISNLLIDVLDTIQDKFFPDIQKYHEMKEKLPLWIDSLGIDPETRLSRDDFNTFINKSHNENYNKILLFSDIETFVSNIQDRLCETKMLFISFFEELSLLQVSKESLNIFSNTVFFKSGPDTLKVYSLLENFFIKLYSLLDLFSKLKKEKESIYNNFSTYPHLKSKDYLYGNEKGFSNNKDTIYEKNKNINLLIELRHSLIHDGTLAYKNFIYFVVNDKSEISKKFLPMIDHSDGKIHSLKFRKRFYSNNDTLNQFLPEFYIDILQRLLKTVIKIKEL